MIDDGFEILNVAQTPDITKSRGKMSDTLGSATSKIQEESKDGPGNEKVDPAKYMVKEPITKGFTEADLLKKNEEFLQEYKGNDTLVDTVCFYGPDPINVIEIDDKDVD